MDPHGGQKYRRERDGLALLVRAVEYRRKGLRINEIARILGIPHQTLSNYMARARKLGLDIPDTRTRPVQGSLLEVAR